MKRISTILYGFKRGVLNIFLTVFDSIFLKTPAQTNISDKPIILIVKMDAIGDFLVWLNVANQYRELFPPSNYDLRLLCNPSCVSVAKANLDFDEIISFDRKKYMLHLKHRVLMFNKLSQYYYEKIIYHSPSREYATGDLLIKKLGSNEKISFRSDHAIDSNFWIATSNKYYSSLFQCNLLSEFDKNNAFLSFLGAENISSTPHKLVFELPIDFILPTDYIVFFIGARIGIRKWEIENFIKLAELFLDETEYNIVLCGGNEDIKDAEIFQNFFEFNIRLTDYVGKTNIQELCYVIDNSKLLIGNETSGIHFAAALKKNSVCILGGGHFNRFVPYPNTYISDYKPTAVYEKMECYNCDWRCKYQLSNASTAPCVSTISVHKVFLAAQKVLEIL